MLHLFLRPAWGAGITEAEMDATKRKITKIAREVSKFTVRTMRAEGIGAVILQAINYSLQFLGVNPYLQYVVRGLIIILAVSIDVRKYIAKK